ncbi:MAG: DUF6089 family protein [Chitinophagales bacterium]
MRCLKTISLLLLLYIQLPVSAQDEEFSKQPTISLFTGLINYQGDLNPNSFTLGRSKFCVGVTFRKPLNRWFTVRAGINYGHLEAADRYNRSYLKARNLSFYTSLKEAHAGLEVNLLNINKTRFTAYLFGGVAIFHFNPWTYDDAGQKIYLKPLSTEGEGLAAFPTQKPYNLNQFALPFGIGVKYAINNNINIGFEFSQRKTFTDHLDDVSSFYVDYQTLLNAKGPKAVELAYRGVPGPNSYSSYPAHGEQRGTPNEMDWYYFAGLNIEIKLNSIGNLFAGIGSKDKSYSQRCPKTVL